jgi:hypothetical protein
MPVFSGFSLRSLKPLYYKLSRLTWITEIYNAITLHSVTLTQIGLWRRAGSGGLDDVTVMALTYLQPLSNTDRAFAG